MLAGEYTVLDGSPALAIPGPPLLEAVFDPNASLKFDFGDFGSFDKKTLQDMAHEVPFAAQAIMVANKIINLSGAKVDADRGSPEGGSKRSETDDRLDIRRGVTVDGSLGSRLIAATNLLVNHNRPITNTHRLAADHARTTGPTPAVDCYPKPPGSA